MQLHVALWRVSIDYYSLLSSVDSSCFFCTCTSYGVGLCTGRPYTLHYFYASRQCNCNFKLPVGIFYYPLLYTPHTHNNNILNTNVKCVSMLIQEQSILRTRVPRKSHRMAKQVCASASTSHLRVESASAHHNHHHRQWTMGIWGSLRSDHRHHHHHRPPTTKTLTITITVFYCILSLLDYYGTENTRNMQRVADAFRC